MRSRAGANLEKARAAVPARRVGSVTGINTFPGPVLRAWKPCADDAGISCGGGQAFPSCARPPRERLQLFKPGVDYGETCCNSHLRVSVKGPRGVDGDRPGRYLEGDITHTLFCFVCLVACAYPAQAILVMRAPIQAASADNL
jgi:hypothetical protein